MLLINNSCFPLVKTLISLLLFHSPFSYLAGEVNLNFPCESIAVNTDAPIAGKASAIPCNR